MEELKYLITGLSDNMNKQFSDLKINMSNVCSTIKNNEKRLNVVEKEMIKRNLIIFGVLENERNYWELERNVIKILKNLNGNNFSENDIDFIYRMGRKGAQNRPIKIGLIAYRKKIEILKNRKQLKGSQVYIEEELTKEEREENKKLIPLMLEKRKEGRHAIVRSGKLFVDGLEIKAENRNTNYEFKAVEYPAGTSNSTNTNENQDNDSNIQNKKRLLSQEEENEELRVNRKPKEDIREVGKLKKTALDKFTRQRTNSLDSYYKILQTNNIENKEDTKQTVNERQYTYNE